MYHRDRDDEITAYADAERLETRMVKKKFAKKKKRRSSSILHPPSTEPSLTNRAKPACFGAELKNAIKSILLHGEVLTFLISTAADPSSSEPRDVCMS